MERRWKGLAFFFGAVVCLFAAWLLLNHFSGRWGSPEPTTVAGPALAVKEELAHRLPPSEPVAERPERVEPSEPWVVYVTGGIRSPGVYQVPPGSRVYLAVEMAGGFSAEGDREAINLAEPLADGRHLHVPRRGEAFLPSSPQPVPSGAVRTSPSGTNPSTSLIDVNRAGAADLATLPGIGPKLAQALVDDREAKGPFRTVDDLKRVRGIGDGKLESIRPFVTVGP